MKAKKWLIGWLIMVVSALGIIGCLIYKVDPYFHFHKPEIKGAFYPLSYQRGQNDGILKHFDYDAIITGTSMTENFRTSEADEVFGNTFVKTCFSGGSYKEISDNVKAALKANPDVKVVVRGLDMSRFLDEWDYMRYDKNEYPGYLYDSNPFNDVEYLYNKDVIDRSFSIIKSKDKDVHEVEMTSFDDYSRWQDSFTWGRKTVCPDGIVVSEPEETKHLTEADKITIEKNIRLNVTDVADEHTDVDFYYFYTPYSVVKWNEWDNEGIKYQMLEAEAYITELIVPHKNIHLFSFNNRFDITTDINNYKDAMHYGSWINSLILKWMHDDEYRLTEDNYEEYLKQEYEFYSTFDISSIEEQEDYEADYLAAALLNHELTGAEPRELIDGEDGFSIEYDMSDISIKTTLSFELDDVYNYLSFDCKMDNDEGSDSKSKIYIYDSEGEQVFKDSIGYIKNDGNEHKVVIDLSTISGDVTVVFQGDKSINSLSDIMIY